MNLANHDLHAWMKEVESPDELRRASAIPWDKEYAVRSTPGKHGRSTGKKYGLLLKEIVANSH
jgi:hypothetical protein